MFFRDRRSRRSFSPSKRPSRFAFAPEDLDDLRPTEGLLEKDGQLCHLLLLALVDPIEAAADHLDHEGDEGKGDEGGHGQHGFSDEHHDEEGNHGARVAHQLDQHRRRQTRQPADVVEHARHELGRMGPAEEGEGHVLDVQEQIAAQSRDHALPHRGHEVPLQVGPHPFDHVGTEHGEGDQLEHEEIASDKDFVHGRLDQPCDGTLHGPRHHRAEPTQGEGRQVRPEVWPQPPERCHEHLHDGNYIELSSQPCVVSPASC